MKKHMMTALVLGIIPGIMMSGCAANNTVKGGAAGAGIGGLIGGIIGKQHDNTATGAIIGATVGGAAGALIGNYMDDQAEEMRRDLENAEVERVGEGIKITFDSAILFEVNSSTLESGARNNIDELASILQKYDDTNIVIEGHTDSSGSEDYNQGLSERRAKSVADYAITRGVSFSRIATVGHGESMPVASNDTETGRRQNRRVEIAIFANDQLRKQAEQGQIQ